ncbi:MAG: hypothetical protein IRY85_22990 [Micromonosporaceae bacterium]|nr:hypothetical protein [Micromonosporaceae bacterium]
MIPYANLLALVNYEPGIIIIYWLCLCGEKHITATGSVGSTDAARATAAIDSVRRQLAHGTTTGYGYRAYP